MYVILIYAYVTYEWVMSHINESCHISMSHVTCDVCNIDIRISLNPALLRAGAFFVPAYIHLCVCNGTFISYQRYVFGKRRRNLQYTTWIAFTKYLCHIWMSHVTHINESCMVGASFTRHIAHLSPTIRIWHIYHPRYVFGCEFYETYGTLILYPWCVFGKRNQRYMTCAWLIHMCDMTHSYVTWLIYMCDMTHSYVT